MAAKKPRIFILIPTFQPNDAVGNDAAGMYRLLTNAGYDTAVYAEHIHHAFASITKKADLSAVDLWNDRDAILIYHHAIVWELGEEILRKSRNKIVIKYHNVTPPGFFANYAQHYYWACVKGQEATARIARIPDIWVWGDSQYNSEEFITLGIDPRRCRVVAPIHRIEELAAGPFDSVVMGAYRNSAITNILFVGGMRPNKGHSKALEVLAAARNMTDRSVRLFFVGNFDPNLKRYTDDLDQYIKHLDLAEDVVVAHSVSPSQLRSYYLLASVFLCVSDHEGFCVPLVESMAFRVPIVAWATTAVGETAGNCGYIHDRFDPEAFGASIADCVGNPATARELATRGRLRYEQHFHCDAIERQLLTLVNEVAAA